MRKRFPLPASRILRSLTWLLLPAVILVPLAARAGAYLDSAHGDNKNGVFRAKIGNAPPSGYGYARGNCTHCHEQHASINGGEPEPVTGPAFFTLFAPGFDTSAKTHPYAESDTFCFYCHNDSGSAQAVLNNDYSQTFGCAGQGSLSILDQMNGVSYHNLYDMYTYAGSAFNWFKTASSPCAVCHNPHLARRNKAAPTDITFSALSRPTDHFSLWGTTAAETMDGAYNTGYEPPFCSSSQNDREPAASGDANSGRASTPDYTSFCTTCHNTSTVLTSTTLNRNIEPLDWGGTGDKHGQAGDTPGPTIKAPYQATGSYVLSCLDCHESHGAPNLMLLRRRINGQDLESAVTTADSNEWGYVCKRCHMDDLDAVDAGLPSSSFVHPVLNQWRYVHHEAEDAPFRGPFTKCSTCHAPGPPGPISCGTTGITISDCHGHGRIF